MERRAIIMSNLGSLDSSNRNLFLDSEKSQKSVVYEVMKKPSDRKIHALAPIDRKVAASRADVNSIINKTALVAHSPESQPENSSNTMASSLVVLEKLRLKLKEYEIDNDQLKKKLQFSEEVIKALKSSPVVDDDGTPKEIITREMSTQTVKEVSQDRTLSLLKQSLESTEKKLILSLTERDNLLKSLSDVCRELSLLQASQKSSKDEYESSIEMYQEKIRDLESTIQELNVTNSLSEKHGPPTMEQTSVALISKIKDIHREFQSLKRDYAKLKATVDVHNGINIGKQTSTSFQILESKLRMLQSNHDSKIESFKEAVDLSQAETESMRSQLATEQTNSASLRQKLSDLENIYQNEARLHQMTQEKIDSLKSKIVSDSNSHDELIMKCREKDDEIYQLMRELKEEIIKSEQRGVQIQTAKTCLFEYQEKLKGEIQSYRHDAHVKDLVRVASIREITLERDKVLLELQSAR
jgi:hypothetical protein